jgi:glutamyl/glutaminyl-tRNA synthetase
MDRLDIDRSLRVRFAVSPAGALHAADARIALFNWLLARKTGGALVLRVQDGSRPEAPEVPDRLDELRWLGLAWDEGPGAGGAYGPYRQSERGAVYRAHAGRLLASGAAYERGGRLWFRVPPGTSVVDDLVLGEVSFEHRTISDFALRHPDEAFAPAFVNAVDDATMRIDLVLREERLEDAARESMLARALGYEPPRYAHAGPLLGPDHHALAQRSDAPTIGALRRAGYLPEAVIEHLALLGWSPPDGRETFGLDELAAAFSLERVHGSPAVFDAARLRAFNARALRALPRERYHALIAERMRRAGLLEEPAPPAAERWVETFLDAFGDEVHTLGEALEQIAALRAEAVTVPALELERLRNRQVLFFLDAVSQYVDDQPELRGLPLEHDVPAIADEFGIAKDDAFAALRMALTGTHDGPPLSLLFPLLGHERIMIRIGAISSHILHGRGLEPIKFGPGGVPFETIQPAPPPREATGHDTEGS